jgi:hypothetical protein
MVLALIVMLIWDLLYSGLMTITSMEFDILAKKVAEAKSADDLKKLIKIHQELIEVTEKLEEIFSPLLLVNISTSISILCVAAFLVDVRWIFLKLNSF